MSLWFMCIACGGTFESPDPELADSEYRELFWDAPRDGPVCSECFRQILAANEDPRADEAIARREVRHRRREMS